MAKVVEWDTTGSASSSEAGIASSFDIALDNQENPYILGRITKGGHVDFDPGPGTAIIIPETKMQVFVLKLNTMGYFEWVSTTQGNTDSEAEGYKLAIDKHNNIYARGRFLSMVDFDPGVDTFLLNGIGMNSGFCFKWAQCPLLVDSTDAIACNSYTINGQTFHSSGVYTIALTNSTGCDSIVKLNITLEPLVNTFQELEIP